MLYCGDTSMEQHFAYCSSPSHLRTHAPIGLPLHCDKPWSGSPGILLHGILLKLKMRT